jgi:hypothetical protein
MFNPPQLSVVPLRVWDRRRRGEQMFDWLKFFACRLVSGAMRRSVGTFPGDALEVQPFQGLVRIELPHGHHLVDRVKLNPTSAKGEQSLMSQFLQHPS